MEITNEMGSGFWNLFQLVWVRNVPSPTDPGKVFDHRAKFLSRLGSFSRMYR